LKRHTIRDGRVLNKIRVDGYGIQINPELRFARNHSADRSEQKNRYSDQPSVERRLNEFH